MIPSISFNFLLPVCLPGEFGSIDTGSGLVLIPILSLLFNRRCINVEDGIGIVFAFVGVFLVLQPKFILAQMDSVTTTA